VGPFVTYKLRSNGSDAAIAMKCKVEVAPPPLQGTYVKSLTKILFGAIFFIKGEF
jgi:hypothetical protein